ncbi:MAG TPA: assimilatory sulfite reductase (NADPH) flavoprotein subunit [Casimicrobiaceae bacterium]|nr:assimilatory sulfite reductase (NADPH) flavoprotein subunit [Casimicrobiaceae bacterium]
MRRPDSAAFAQALADPPALLSQPPSLLSDEQVDALDRLIEPLSPDQLIWIGGYLAGLATARRAGTPRLAPAPADDDEAFVTIVYGSQSGNSAGIAADVKAQAEARGLDVRVKSMDEYRPSDLRTEKKLLIVVSTQGEGEPPDSGKELHEFLHGRKAGKLEGLRYSVLALGDSSYEHFCQTGRDFDARLEALGAERAHPRVDCDVDYDDAAAQWIEGALAALTAAPARALSHAVAARPLRGNVTPLHSKKNPFLATALANINLSGHGSAKEVRHLELSLEASALSYEPGDSVGVLPANEPEVVADLLDALHLDPSQRVDLGTESATLGFALAHRYEITTLTRPLVEKYAALGDAQALRDLLAAENGGDLWQYLRGRQLIDLVTEHPLRGIGATQLLSLLRRLPPRLYSIASSQKANPGELHVTVAAVRYESHGRNRHGVASTFLADRIAEGDTVPIYVETNRNFKLPSDPATPIVMVGPGTGVAPFRAFVQEREAIGASGRSWLFFGDRHFTTDFLYQREWQQNLKDGALTRMDVAFSRDREHKCYVQHRMKAQARDLYAWLQDGAHFYVCGDAERMARDVHQALIEIVAEQGAMPVERATEYVQALQRSRRYQRDVY